MDEVKKSKRNITKKEAIAKCISLLATHVHRPYQIRRTADIFPNKKIK